MQETLSPLPRDVWRGLFRYLGRRTLVIFLKNFVQTGTVGLQRTIIDNRHHANEIHERNRRHTLVHCPFLSIGAIKHSLRDLIGGPDLLRRLRL